MSSPVLSARGLQVHLGGSPVLRGIDADFAAPGFTAVVGPNGAGKSTLLRALAGLQPIDAGEVQLGGRALSAWPTRQRARQLAWLGQDEPQSLEQRCHDLVLLGRLPHLPWLGRPGANDLQAVQDAMQSTQCWAWRERTLASLSAGERQRVLLARALAVQAPLLLMDEPVANLDPPQQAQWLRAARQHVAGGGTLLAVLHELHLALQADHLLVLREGRVLHHGPAGDAAARSAVEQVFDGRVAIHAVAGQWAALPV